MSIKRKSVSYFAGTIDQAHTKHGYFEVGDAVKALPSNKKFPCVSGEISKLARSDHGNGRIYAWISRNGINHIFPVGALRHI